MYTESNMKIFKRKHSLFLIYTSCLVIMLLLGSMIVRSYPANAFGLKVAPLKYEAQLELGDEKIGYVDVSNPNDFTVTVTPEIEAFRQIDTDGNLEFYEDIRLQEGITLNQNKFDLGPRKAARVFFTINSNNLPEGGVYGALLFGVNNRGGQSDERSSIATTTRVGTLLLLKNGDAGVRKGRISRVDIPLWQFGEGIEGNVAFHTQKSRHALAFEPQLQFTIPLAGKTDVNSGIVFPGNTRDFTIQRQGNYFGIFPVEVTDEITGSTQRSWVVAITGIWQIIIPAVFIAVVIIITNKYRHKAYAKYLLRKHKLPHRHKS